MVFGDASAPIMVCISSRLFVTAAAALLAGGSTRGRPWTELVVGAAGLAFFGGGVLFVRFGNRPARRLPQSVLRDLRPAFGDGKHLMKANARTADGRTLEVLISEGGHLRHPLGLPPGDVVSAEPG